MYYAVYLENRISEGNLISLGAGIYTRSISGHACAWQPTMQRTINARHTNPRGKQCENSLPSLPLTYSLSLNTNLLELTSTTHSRCHFTMPTLFIFTMLTLFISSTLTPHSLNARLYCHEFWTEERKCGVDEEGHRSHEVTVSIWIGGRLPFLHSNHGGV